jgi:hypothetical protein
MSDPILANVFIMYSAACLLLWFVSIPIRVCVLVDCLRAKRRNQLHRCHVERLGSLPLLQLVAQQENGTPPTSSDSPIEMQCVSIDRRNMDAIPLPMVVDEPISYVNVHMRSAQLNVHARCSPGRLQAPNEFLATAGGCPNRIFWIATEFCDGRHDAEFVARWTRAFVRGHGPHESLTGMRRWVWSATTEQREARFDALTSSQEDAGAADLEFGAGHATISLPEALAEHLAVAREAINATLFIAVEPVTSMPSQTSFVYEVEIRHSAGQSIGDEGRIFSTKWRLVLVRTGAEVMVASGVFEAPPPNCSAEVVSEDCLCVVCLTAPRNLILFNCGHCCLCFRCGSRLQKCPVCRSDITGTAFFGGRDNSQ